MPAHPQAEGAAVDGGMKVTLAVMALIMASMPRGGPPAGLALARMHASPRAACPPMPGCGVQGARGLAAAAAAAASGSQSQQRCCGGLSASCRPAGGEPGKQVADASDGSLPARYDPDAISAHFNTRPMMVRAPACMLACLLACLPFVASCLAVQQMLPAPFLGQPR
jgi:hypothetical protein